MRHTGPGASRAGRAHRHERARAADQPRPAARRAGRVRRRAAGARAGRGARGPRRVRAGGARRRRARRADHDDHQHRVGGRRRGGTSRGRRPGGARGGPGDAGGPARRRRRASTPRCSGAVLAGERGPVRDAVLLNAAGALVAFDGVAAGPPADVHAALAAAAGPGGSRPSIPERGSRCWPAGWSCRRCAAARLTRLACTPSLARRTCSAAVARPAGRWPVAVQESRPTSNVASVSARDHERKAMWVSVRRTPSTLLSRPAITSASCSCSGHLDHRDEVDVAGAGVDLVHAVEVRDGLRGLGDPVGGDMHQDDRGDHASSSGSGRARREHG